VQADGHLVSRLDAHHLQLTAQDTKGGQRFLVNTAVPTPLPVTVVSDWTAALKK